ncbi:MAG: hypothetical protein LBB74_06380, partial [Chitinispirillales bacterium]|nr:hypothetical protein [Chitinispirillales bacterium]
DGDKDLAPLDVETVEPSQIVEANQIIEMYWSYGDEFTRLKSRDTERDAWNSRRYSDLNFHVVTEDGNDGKTVEVTIENDDGLQIDLSGIVSKNNVVFEKVFEDYETL